MVGSLVASRLSLRSVQMGIVPSTRLVVAVCLERQWLRGAIAFSSGFFV